jgi:co-chaperonin GroES (HSP10)
MIQITEEMIAQARDLIAYGNPKAVGYRLMIKPIEAITGMEMSEEADNPELAKLGFVTKTEEQAAKESVGTHHGILASKGDYAFKAAALGGDDWATEGDVLIFDRYAGVEIELPPGSGEKYRFTNDESILGKMEAKK